MIFSYFDCSSPFNFCSFHCTFPYLIKYYHIMLLIILFWPPRGSEWIISVGDYVDNSFTALGSSDHREVRLELWLGFYVFHFRFVQVHLVFCYLYFITLFPCSIKYYHIMFINIVPQGTVDGYRCRLVRKFIHCFGA